MHWVTTPGHLAARGGPDHPRREPRPAGDPGRAQFRLAHRPGAARRGDRRRRLRRELDQHRSDGRLRRDARARSRRSPTATPGMFRNVETYLNERIDEVLTGSSDQIVGPHLRTGPRRAPRAQAEVASKLTQHRRHRRRPPRAAGRHAAGPGRGEPSRGAGGTGSSRATSDGPPRPSCRARRSATSSRRARPTTSTSGAMPGRAPASSDIKHLPIDTPGQGAGAAELRSRA